MNAAAIQERSRDRRESQESTFLEAVGIGPHRLGERAGEFSDLPFECFFGRTEKIQTGVTLKPKTTPQVATVCLPKNVRFTDDTEKLADYDRQLMRRNLFDHPLGVQAEKRE